MLSLDVPSDDVLPRRIPPHLCNVFPVPTRLVVTFDGGTMGFDFRLSTDRDEVAALAREMCTDVYAWVLTPILRPHLGYALNAGDIAGIRHQVEAGLRRTAPHWQHVLDLSVAWPD